MVTADSPGDGQGSTFVVKLPLSLHQGRKTATPGGAGFDVPVESIASLQILIVDDEIDVRGVLMLMLESRGARVQLAASAADALRLVDELNPDLLLADLGMPGEDGLALLRKIRDRESARGTERLPAIAVTAYASPGDRDHALAAGYDWHLPKPVDPDELVRAIAKVRKPNAV